MPNLGLSVFIDLNQRVGGRGDFLGVSQSRANYGAGQVSFPRANGTIQQNAVAGIQVWSNFRAKVRCRFLIRKKNLGPEACLHFANVTPLAGRGKR